MPEALAGKQIAFLTANEGVEQVELTRPWEAVRDAGGRPVLAAPKSGEVQAYNHLEKGDSFAVDLRTEELDIDDYAGVVLPGGVANPDQLRLDRRGGPVPSVVRGGRQAGGGHLPRPLEPRRG